MQARRRRSQETRRSRPAARPASPRPTVRELQAQLVALQAQLAAQAAQPPARQYDAWTAPEDQQLLAAFTARDMELEDIAACHRRAPSAIASRAGKLGIVPNAYAMGGGVDEQILVARNVLANRDPLFGFRESLQARRVGRQP